jgi:MFS family permease
LAVKSNTIRRVREFSLWQPLSVRDFRLLWLGQGVSLFGDQFYLVALPWLTLQLTGSGLALGTVLMVAGGARAIFQLLGGALSDRFSARSLMLISNIVRAAATAAITALVIAGAVELWHLYALSIVFGVVDAFFFPASVSVVPMLVVKEYLTAGNALLRGTNRLMALIGPAIAGLVVFHQSLGSAFAIDTATFVFAAFMIWLMKKQGRTRSSDEQPDEQVAEPARFNGLLASIGEGLRYAWKHPLVRSLLFFIAIIEFCFVGPSSVGLAAMAKTRFEVDWGASALGWMLSAFGGGMLIGMVVAGSIKVKRGRGRLIIGVIFLLGFGLTFLGFAHQLVWAGATLVFIGMGGGLANIIILSLLQSETERRMLGRVMGLLMFGSTLLESLSYALAGVIADKNLTALFVGGGALIIVASLMSLGGRTLRATN